MSIRIERADGRMIEVAVKQDLDDLRAKIDGVEAGVLPGSAIELEGEYGLLREEYDRFGRLAEVELESGRAVPCPGLPDVFVEADPGGTEVSRAFILRSLPRIGPVKELVMLKHRKGGWLVVVAGTEGALVAEGLAWGYGGTGPAGLSWVGDLLGIRPGERWAQRLEEQSSYRVDLKGQLKEVSRAEADDEFGGLFDCVDRRRQEKMRRAPEPFSAEDEALQSAGLGEFEPRGLRRRR